MKSKAWFNDLSCRHKHKATYTDCILLWSLEPIARTKDTNQQQVTASFKLVCANMLVSVVKTRPKSLGIIVYVEGEKGEETLCDAY